MVLTAPSMRTLWVIPAGIHVPRCGGVARPRSPRSPNCARRPTEQLMAAVAMRTDSVPVGIVGGARDDRPADLGEERLGVGFEHVPVS